MSTPVKSWLLCGVKRCDYCGKEYPDEAVVCAVDRNPLIDPAGAAEKKAEFNHLSDADLKKIEVAYPEYQWSATDGLKFIGMILVFSVVWYGVTGALYRIIPPFYHWRWGPYGFLVMALVYASIRLVVAAYFGRTETVSSFCKAVGLDRKPTSHAWFGVTAALGIVMTSRVAHTLGWAKSYFIYDTTAFREARGSVRYLFLVPMLLAPFWEEMVNRGFLYKAFRGSYSVPLSMIVIVGYTAYTHWNRYSHFGMAVISLSSLTVVQCYVREKSESLWNCILLHFVYNASGLLIGGVLRF